MADPGYLDLFVYQGASYNTAVTLTDVNNSPINLANFTINSTIKKSYITPNVAANFTTTTTNISGGVVELSLSRQTTANLIPHRYVYDVLLLNTINDSATRILEGTIYLCPGTSVFP
jgi:hypothetical protein